MNHAEQFAAAPFESWPFCAQAALFSATLAVFVVVAMLMSRDAKAMKAGGAGIVTFELAGTADMAHAILTKWGADGRRAARRDLWLDVGLILGYAVGLSVVFSSAVAGVSDAGGPCWAAAARLFAWLPPLAGVADLGEDFCLARTLRAYHRNPKEPSQLNGWPQVASILARAKFSLLAVSAGWAVLVLWPLLIP
jgi:hypothetical protein